jgi:hypothetical protein
LRLASGLTIAAFCRGSWTSQWANYEAAEGVSLKAAMRLIERIDGLTLDWLCLGRGGLPSGGPNEGKLTIGKFIEIIDFFPLPRSLASG